jgi:hypothetical protein
MKNGTPGTPVEYLCDVIHARARYLGLIGESEMVWKIMDGRIGGCHGVTTGLRDPGERGFVLRV